MRNYPSKILLSKLMDEKNFYVSFDTEKSRKEYYEGKGKAFTDLPYDLWIFDNDFEAEFIGMTGTGPFAHPMYLAKHHHHYCAFVLLDWDRSTGLAAPLEKYNLNTFEIED